MITTEMPESEYEVMRVQLPEICPYATFHLIAKDVNLAKLGFVDEPLCLVGLDMSWETYFRMMDDLEQLEIDAYNGPYDQESMDRYKKYGWLWALFFERVKETNDPAQAEGQ